MRSHGLISDDRDPQSGRVPRLAFGSVMHAMVRCRVAAITAVCLLVTTTSRGASDESPIVAGPMVGHATQTVVNIWVQTRRPATVAISYWNLAAVDEVATSVHVRTGAANCATVKITGLPFGTRFGYRVEVDGAAVELPQALRFQTQVHWRARSSPPDFLVAIGSCAYVNDPPYDRVGEAYGGERVIYRAMAADRPDLMLWLGDNVYFREPDWTAESEMQRRYSRSRSVPELQALLGATHHYAIWDDHDYGPNDSDWTFPLRKAALRTFELFWANPTYGLADHPGCFTRFTWGDAEFFLLDDRYHRSPNRTPISPEKRMFGERQMRWLLDSLTSSKAKFKIVAGGSQILNPLCFYEGMGDFPHERDEMLAGIKKRKIRGLLFLSGDRHHTELIKIERSGAYPLYDYTSSPLLSGTHAAGREKVNAARVPGTLVVEKRNYGLLRFLGKSGGRKVELEARDETGKTLWKRAITAAELRD